MPVCIGRGAFPSGRLEKPCILTILLLSFINEIIKWQILNLRGKLTGRVLYHSLRDIIQAFDTRVANGAGTSQEDLMSLRTAQLMIYRDVWRAWSKSLKYKQGHY